MSEFTHQTPSLQIEINGKEVSLTWYNCRIRFFGEAWKDLWHVEYFEGGQVQPFIAEQDLIDALMDGEYPYTFEPVPPSDVLDRFTEKETEDLDEEINQLLS